MATCPRCGNSAPDEDRFCRTCGGYLTAATPGFEEAATELIPTQDPRPSRPPRVPAIDDGDDDAPVPHPPEGDGFDAARLPMNAYPVERPPADDWPDAPDQGWYAQSPPNQEAPAPPYPQATPHGQAPPYEQAPPHGQPWTYGQPPPYAPQGDGPGHGGYEAPGYFPYDDSPQKRGNGGRTAILAVVGAIAVVALVFGSVLFIGSRRHNTVDAGSTTSSSASATGGTSHSASPVSSVNSPRKQATAVNGLLDRAVSGKSMLATTYEQAVACKISPSDAATRFEQAAKNRRAIVTSARRLDTSKLPNGTRIRQLLISMYSTSARADDAFAAWARAGDSAGDSCLKGNAKRTKGNSLSVKAGKQKKTFTTVWNPVARTYGQPTRTKNRL